jgi:hypothetical protein
MPKNRTISGEWVSGKNKIECTLPLIIFEEENNLITYCPALDLSGYGSTEEDSNRSFEQVLSEYFRYTVNKKTLADDLRKMGWILRKNSLRNKPVPPTMEDLLGKNEDFSRIFNNHDFRKTTTTINMPAFAY